MSSQEIPEGDASYQNRLSDPMAAADEKLRDLRNICKAYQLDFVALVLQSCKGGFSSGLLAIKSHSEQGTANLVVRLARLIRDETNGRYAVYDTIQETPLDVNELPPEDKS